MFEQPKISIFAASVRPHLWKAFFGSLKSNDLQFEVVFAGNLAYDIINLFSPKFEKPNQFFHYIQTGNIKPAQAAEIARRHCEGELLHWSADDAEYSLRLIDRIWESWKKFNDYRTIVSCQTIEDGSFVLLERHRLFWKAHNTPQMAPLGFISSILWDKLGGIDRRFVSGQWDNDILMRALNVGAEVVLFTEGGEISLDHRGKHGGNQGTFRSGYPKDREVLEGAWAPQGKDTDLRTPPFQRYDGGFEPFDHAAPDFLTVSQSNKGMWE